MKTGEQTDHALCPSAKCQDGAQLIGIVKEDGHIDLLKEAIEIDQTFVDIANEGRMPEMRFRFANKCIKNGCKQWTGESCGMITQIMKHVVEEGQTIDDTLPECSIRPSCRWFKQTGAEACKVCPFVITDISQLF